MYGFILATAAPAHMSTAPLGVRIDIFALRTVLSESDFRMLGGYSRSVSTRVPRPAAT